MAEKKTFNLSKITAELVGAPYRLGGLEQAAGFDCFSLIYQYLIMRGVDLPKQYKGLTLETYKDLYETDPEQATRVMIEFVEEHMEEIPRHRMFAGDVALARVTGEDRGHAFLVIDGGNGNIICATEELGVSITSVKYYKIERVFRCRHYYH